MGEPSRKSDPRAVLQRAFLELKELRARLTELERRRREPIAIVGAACRFPGGADSPEAFWRLLCEGVDATTEVPGDRWDADAFYDPDPDAVGKMYCRRGSFLGRVDGFDAHFFAITPREAVGMDPQQRLLLEVAWEALENAGQVPDRLVGSNSGVFLGIMNNDYLQLGIRAADPADLDGYFGTGNGASVASGRVAYVLGLQGPTLSIDSACSSSLVSTHLACRSLRAGECDLALAGGVNLILSEQTSVLSCRLRALSPDGRCKTFDAAADGYGRGEGCGVLVLKRLSDATAAGDPILALIRGGAVNHDGRSNGLTAPNGPAQEAVIRRALDDAGLDPAEIGYVEAHGTGTPLGDPIEVRALGAVLGAGRSPRRPLMLGSVKTNLGHLESAAGVAGLLKVALALKHREIPPHLHFKELNPHISLREIPASIVTERQAWVTDGGPRLAGVSAFGISGTNAHLVLEEAPAEPSPSASPKAEDRAWLLPLSARDPEALAALAAAYRDELTGGGLAAASLHDVCTSAALRRSHHPRRLAVTGHDPGEIAEHLQAFLDGEMRPGTSHGRERAGVERKVVFVFPGQGSQWVGMGRQLLRREAAFREAVEACDAALRAHVDWSLLELLTADPAPASWERIDVIQPALFSIQVALAAQWRAWGIEPAAVAGQSMGEIAAAHVAGSLSLDHALSVICRRSRLLRRMSGRGAMALVELSLNAAREVLRGFEDRLSVAVSSSPGSTVLSGEPQALREVLAALERRDVFCREIQVDVASHSPQMEPLGADLARELADVAPRPGGVPVYSTVTGEATDGRDFDAAYWWRNLRQPVLFADAVERLAADGHDVFLELSPHPVLLNAIEQCLRDGGHEGLVLPSLRRDEPDQVAMLGAWGGLYATGYPVDWGRLLPPGGRFTRLPTYPWQRERFWLHLEGTRGGPRGPVATTSAPAASAAAGRRNDDLAARLAAASPDLRRQQLKSYLRERAAGVMKLAPARLDVDLPLNKQGLDSLMAIELKRQVEVDLGVSLPVTRLLRGPDLGGLSREIGELLSPGAAPAPSAAWPGADANGDGGESPLSYGQRALWFLYRLAPLATAYNVVFAWRVRPRLDEARLRRVFDQLIARHAVLRTTYRDRDGQAVQRVRQRVEADFESEDAVDWDLPTLHQRLLDAAHRPFDLEQGPIVRVRLLRRSGDAHVMLFATHHIAFDLWSMQVLMEELSILYAADAAAEPAVLPPLAVEYTDFVRWQEEMLAGDAGRRLEAFWRRQLGGVLPVLELPADRPRPPVQGFRGASQDFALGAGLCDRLQALSRQTGTTLFTILLAAFQALLGRLTGQRDVLVGSPTTTRSRPELEPLVGYLVNPLVLRGDLSGDPSFAELLERTREVVLTALDHQDYPFPLLVELLQPARDPSRSPLFQVLFILQRAHRFEAAKPPAIGRLELELLPLPERAAQFDLTLMMSDFEGAIEGSLQYDRDLFDAVTMARMGRQFQTLLADLAADPEPAILARSLLSPGERHQLLAEWTDTARPGPALLIHQAFEAQADRVPDAVAVIVGLERLTYRQLDRRANRLAHFLRRREVGAEVLVGICLERSLDAIIALLATLKAGGAYLPLDPAYPPERLAIMLADARPRLVLTGRRQAATLAAGAADVVVLDDARRSVAACPATRPAVPISPDQLAYVLFTSGSTGRPKGVAMVHRGPRALLSWAAAEFSPAELAGTMAATSFCFDLSVFEIFAPLAVGGSVLLAGHALELATLPAAGEVTLVNTVPSALAELLRAGAVPDSVRTFCLAGEVLSRELVRTLYRRPSTHKVYNLYGPTEDTTYSTGVCLDPASRSAPTIGRPLTHTRALLLDPRLEPTPIGVPVELYLGGHGLARGYLGQPGLTASRFLPDRFSEKPGMRLYFTGDRARARHDGVLEFLGRRDHQVKVRGFRIELGEIDAVLEDHPEVRECVSVVRQDSPGGQQVVSYAVSSVQDPAAGGALLGIGDLRDYLGERLPEYMLPASLVLLPALPRTPNGKVDRGALPAPSRRAAGSVSEPRSAVQRQVGEIWQEVLALDRVGLDDNFFELGGNSLLVFRVQHRVRQALGRELSAVELFRAPTVRALARHLEEPRSDPAERQDRIEERARQQKMGMKRGGDEARKRRMIRRRGPRPPGGGDSP